MKQLYSFISLQPFLGIGEASNRVTGKLKLGGETLATIDGKWDQEIYIKDKATGVGCLFLHRHTPSPTLSLSLSLEF